MSDWTSGYVTDTHYTYGYFKELNPMRMRLALLNAGIKPPQQITACELGFGQGLSAAIHAAASETQWYGNDFLPSQACFAQSLAEAGQTNAQFFDDSFAEFLARDDMPKFDFICLHGVWTWISAENRQRIMAFIQKNLNLGGVVYLSYNTQIGWAQLMPLRRLLVQHTQRLGAPGRGTAQKIGDSLQFAEQLLSTQPLHAQNNQQVGQKLQELLNQDPHYLAHEYYNRDWHPMDFADLAPTMAQAKMEYASSANYLDLIETLNLSNEQQQLLNQIPDTALRENTRDFCVDKKFRKDYWIRGVRELNSLQVIEALRAEQVVLTKARGAISLVFEGAIGVADLAAEVYDPILDLLADYQPHSLGEIEQALKHHENIGLQEIVQAMFMFTHRGEIQSAQSQNTIDRVITKTHALNKHLMDMARGQNSVNYLASPVTGGGIEASREHQLMLMGYEQGATSSQSLAEFVWSIYQPQGETLSQNGRPLTTVAENLAELEQRTQHFLNNNLPMYQHLRLIAS